MKNRKYKIIFLSLGGFFLSFSFALAKNFTIYNAANINLPYFSVNGTSGNVGIGLTNPTTPLQFKNNSWISSLNGTGTGVVNMFKVNASNQIEVGAPLNIGSFEFSPDSGLVSFVDMPVSAAPGNGALQGYAFRIDGNNLMTLYSEANGLGGIKNTGMGIGTSVPGAKLDIVGALRTTSATISLLGNSGNRIVMTDDSGNLYATSSSVASGLPAPALGNSGFTLRSTGSAWEANSLIYNNGTNVGIGNTAPGGKLTVSTTNTSMPTLGSFAGVGFALLGGGGNYGLVSGVSGNGDSWLQGQRVDGVTSAYNLLLNPIDGNVGIGTANPGAKLDVNGTLKVRGANRFYLGNVFSMYTDTYNDFYFQNTTGSMYFYNSSARPIGFYTGNTERMLIDSSGNLNINRGQIYAQSSSGNFGIGTTTPQSSLDVEGLIKMRASNITTSSDVINKGYLDSSLQALATSTDAKTLWGGSLTGDIFNKNTGNVGIGTNNPLAKLDVAGTGNLSLIKIGGVSMSSVNGGGDLILRNLTQLRFEDGNNWDYNKWAGIKYDSANNRLTIGGPASSAFTSNTTPPSIKIVLDGGDVGIGKTDPSALLDLAGKFKITDTGTAYNSNSNYWLRFEDILGGNDSLRVQGDFNTTGVIETTGTARPNYVMGNMGVGIADPGTYKLNVSGNTYLNGAATVAGDLTVNGGDININNNNGGINFNDVSAYWLKTASNWGLYWDTSLNQVQFNGLGVTRSAIDLDDGSAYFNGSIGIGTTTPQAKLTVSGGNIFVTDALITSTTPHAVITKSYLDSIVTPSSNPNPGLQSGFWTAGSSNSVYNNNSGNVGIGTNSPGAKFEINGDLFINKDGLAQMIGTGAYSNVYTMYRSAQGGYIGLDATNDAFRIQGGADRKLILGTNNSVFGSSSNSLVINEDGNIGIGTTNPQVKLDVSGVVSAINNAYGDNNGALILGGQSPNIIQRLQRDGGGYGFSIFKAFADNTTNGLSSKILDYGAYGDLKSGAIEPTIEYAYFGVGPSASLYNTHIRLYNNLNKVVSFDGNVGINTTSPGYRLDVAGDGKFLGQVHGVSLPTQGTDAANRNYVDGLAFWSGTLTGNVSNLNSGNVGIGTVAPDAKLDVAGQAWFGVTNKLKIQEIADAVSLQATLSTVDTTKKSIILNAWGGNVGIGTTNPLEKLDVSVADNKYGLRIVSYASDNTFNGIRFSYDAGVKTNDYYIGKIEAWKRPGGGGDLILNAASASNSYNTSQLVLSKNGNVGIGTTTPATALHVNGVITATGFSGAMNSTVSAANVTPGEFGSMIGAGGNYIFAASQTGKVGIGIAAPGGKLDVNGGALRLSGGAYLDINRSAAAASGISWYSQSYNAWSDYMASPGANMGPKGNLTAPSGALVTGWALRSFIENANGFGWTFESELNSSTAPKVKFEIRANDGSFHSYGNGFIDGAVGIGTTNPGTYKLKVVGNAAITGTLQTMTGSDFAEEFTVSYPIEAGTVVVMGDLGYKSVKACSQKYDTTVVGIVSDDPSIIAGKVDSKHKAVVAMMGVVKVKVTDVNGKIKKGTLLTTSSIPGYAMKSSDYTPGTMIGKALEDLSGSRGEIKVLVNLQ